MSTAYRAAFFAKYAQTLMDQRAAEKVVFEGNLLLEDGTADLPRLTAAREEWRRQRTLRNPEVELPSALSVEDYRDPLNRRTPSPQPENWDCPPTTPEEDQAAPHVADPNFDWGNIRQLPPAADLQE
jgi:hypothetical protein